MNTNLSPDEIRHLWWYWGGRSFGFGYCAALLASLTRPDVLFAPDHFLVPTSAGLGLGAVIGLVLAALSFPRYRRLQASPEQARSVLAKSPLYRWRFPSDPAVVAAQAKMSPLSKKLDEVQHSSLFKLLSPVLPEQTFIPPPAGHIETGAPTIENPRLHRLAGKSVGKAIAWSLFPFFPIFSGWIYTRRWKPALVFLIFDSIYLRFLPWNTWPEQDALDAFLSILFVANIPVLIAIAENAYSIVAARKALADDQPRSPRAQSKPPSVS